MNPLWKAQNLSSSSATLTILILASLLKGLRSQNSAYNLTVPASVSVQRGLCAHIPCSFTYNRRHRNIHAKLYGYWIQYKHGDLLYFDYSVAPGILVATNDQWGRIRPYAENRFQLTGEPEEGNCSFSILDAHSEDAGEYYFRTQDHDFEYSYLTQKVQVHVTVKPQIWASSAVLSGKEAVYSCSTPGPCIEIEPMILWRTNLTGYSVTWWSQQHSNSSWTYGSNFTFTPSLSDQGQWLTCQVWYPNILSLIQNTIQLDVADPPKTVEISTNATERGHLVLCFMGDLDIAVAQEGESISLQCTAENNPVPTLRWRKGNETLSCTRQGMECFLSLSDVRLEDAGEYQCRAETPHGSATKTLRLCVLSSHNNIWGSSAILFLIILCLFKVLFCFVFFSAIRFSNQRKAPLREKQSTMKVT